MFRNNSLGTRRWHAHVLSFEHMFELRNTMGTPSKATQFCLAACTHISTNAVRVTTFHEEGRLITQVPSRSNQFWLDVFPKKTLVLYGFGGWILLNPTGPKEGWYPAANRCLLHQPILGASSWFETRPFKRNMYYIHIYIYIIFYIYFIIYIYYIIYYIIYFVYYELNDIYIIVMSLNSYTWD